MTSDVPLQWRNIEVIPLIHGRLPFAIAVRQFMLSKRHAALAVELPASLQQAVQSGLDRLPKVSVVLYREKPALFGGMDPEFAESLSVGEQEAWYLPLDPCDGIIEGLRVARGERLPVHFVDAEIEQFVGRPVQLPDPHALLTLGVDAFYRAVLPNLRLLHPPAQEDLIREKHMAARLRQLSERLKPGRELLFLCGMAHWERIREHLAQDSGVLLESEGPPPEFIDLVSVRHESMCHVLGETPFATWCYEDHRSGIDLEHHDQIDAVKELLLETREVYELSFPDSLERATPARLRLLMCYVRKLTLQSGRLMPDLYHLVVAAKGVVGNDFALTVLEKARRYPPNLPSEGPAKPESPDAQDGEDLSIEMTGARGRVRDELTRLILRTPGEGRELKRVRLEAPPPRRDQNRWRSVWNPLNSCSWPPEDVIIENFRNYVGQRTLTLAGLDRVRTEEFTSSLKDGLAIRETLRDLPRGKLHVKVEPRVPGRVGAVVIIFEEDDDGTKYPWRSTWMAEHEEESSLAFYATNFTDDMVGPGIGRARYGGCMMIFPPLWFPDIWDDLRFERARRPSERLLLSALFHTPDRFVAHISRKPPAPEVCQTAAAMGKHIVHLPLSSFSSHMMERIRRLHVLNDKVVRSWAARFIR